MRLSSLLFLLFSCTCVLAQNEFTIHANGFIYPEATMSDLGMIVDSLDLRFRQCDLDRDYRALPQAMGARYKIPGRNWRNVMKILEGAIEQSTMDIPQLFPTAALNRRSVVYENSGTTRSPGLTWNMLPLNYGYNLTVNLEEGRVKRLSDRIVVVEERKTVYVWVLDEAPQATIIPTKYARLIQYVDCMVDTSQRIFREQSVEATGGYLDDGKADDAAEEFMNMLEEYPEPKPKDIWHKKGYPSNAAVRKWSKATKMYQEGQLAWIQEQVKINDNIREALEGLAGTIRSGRTVGERAELILESCGYPKMALDSKRLRKVYGSCSQDDSPRIHAMQIARLSAASVEWSVFLRAHLNIMNDRFERASDGSYAFGRRGTYLGELEALGIDAVGLLVGSCLDAQGMADHHYEGSWNRVGRALTEAKDTEAVIDLITSMIRDDQLDDLNRLTGVYLLRFMAANYGQEKTNKRYTRALAKALTGVATPWAKLLKVE